MSSTAQSEALRTKLHTTWRGTVLPERLGGEWIHASLSRHLSLLQLPVLRCQLAVRSTAACLPGPSAQSQRQKERLLRLLQWCLRYVLGSTESCG